MRVRGMLVAGLAAVSAIGAIGSARAVEPCERQCKIEAGDKYLASLVSHDASNVPLADDAQRWENGGNSGNGAEAIRAANASPIMYVITGIQDLHWEVEGDYAVATYYLDTVAPTYIVERFRVNAQGLIEEIVANFYIDTTGYASGPESLTSNPDRQRTRFTEYNHGPAGPVPVSAGNTGDDDARPASACGPACVAGAANAFLDAMASHNPDAVPLAGDATQRINHRSIDGIRTNLAAANGITGIADRHVLVDGERAVAIYNIVVGDTTLHAATRFRVVGGTIVDVDAVCDGAEYCTA